jgi:hypothetical protein
VAAPAPEPAAETSWAMPSSSAEPTPAEGQG